MELFFCIILAVCAPEIPLAPHLGEPVPYNYTARNNAAQRGIYNNYPWEFDAPYIELPDEFIDHSYDSTIEGEKHISITPLVNKKEQIDEWRKKEKIRLNGEASQTKIYIFYDDSKISKLLIDELTRDWTKPRLEKLSEKSLAIAKEFNEKQEFVKKHVKLVHRLDKGFEKYRYLDQYPSYSRSLYEDAKKFDEKSFMTSSFPLLTVETIVYNEVLLDGVLFKEISLWERKCEHLKREARFDYADKIVEWALKNKKEELEKFFENEWDGDEEPLIKLWGKCENFPKFIQKPELPPDPRRKFPWEQKL